MESILILGATGNITKATAQLLIRKYPEISLRLASSRSAGCERLREQFPHADVVQADWYDYESLVNAMKGVDRIFIVVPDFVTDENVATPNIIKAIQANGKIKQVVRLISIPEGLTAEKLGEEFLATQCGANTSTIAKPLFDASNIPMTYINVPCWIMFNLEMFLAQEIKASRRLVMPSVTDADRLWVAEQDIVDVAAKILTDRVEDHVGKEHVLTGQVRYNYAQVAELISQAINDTVTVVDDAEPLKQAMGDLYDKLMTYYRHEVKDYLAVKPTDTIEKLLKRPQMTLAEYLQEKRSLFV